MLIGLNEVRIYSWGMSLAGDLPSQFKVYLDFLLSKVRFQVWKDCPTVCIDRNLIIRSGPWMQKFSEKAKKEGFEYLVAMHEFLHAFQGHLWVTKDFVNKHVPGGISNNLINIAMDLEVNHILLELASQTRRFSQLALDTFKANAYCPLKNVPPRGEFWSFMDWLRYIKKNPKGYSGGDGEGQGGGGDVPLEGLAKGTTQEDLKKKGPIGEGLRRGTDTMSDEEFIILNPQGYISMTKGFEVTKKIKNEVSLLSQFRMGQEENYSFWRLSTLNLAGIVPWDLRIMGIKLEPPKERVCFFIDTSGSMSSEILSKVWSTIAPHVVIFSDPYYAMVDTELHKVAPIMGPDSFKNFIGRGGTAFQGALQELKAKYNFGKYFVYTDGYCDLFEYDHPEQLVWMIVPGGSIEIPKQVGGVIVELKE